MSRITVQARELFIDLIDIADPVERMRLLDSRCEGDPELRALMEQLLKAQGFGDDLFDFEPELYASSNGEDVNAQIGPYQLVNRLGVGGFGTVYLAKQKEPINRDVALKIIRIGRDTKNIVKRFEQERQTLALMSHPNIAGVLDAGETAFGLPYFVMELVKGVPITEYCDSNRLTIKERLRLFVQVCNAVQHAHQKGIIHYDIKPTNILVSQEHVMPLLKLIDFGIAKAINEPNLSDGSAGELIGTPAYMSPEQAERNIHDIDTRSDIYGLGVLLCELIAGSPPHTQNLNKTFSIADNSLLKIIRGRKTVLPSTRLRGLSSGEQEALAEKRNMSGRQVVKAVKGELDSIAQKALQHDREDRYDSVTQLVYDIEKYLSDDAIATYSTDRIYRFRKHVGRNRLAYIFGTCFVITFIMGVGVLMSLYIRERKHLELQTQLRTIAQTALKEEESLRMLAEARENIAYAAVALRHGDKKAADALVADIPIDIFPPSLETAETMVELGAWHALGERWDLAASRYMVVAKAITRVDSTDTGAVSQEFIPASASIIESGDYDGYEILREEAINRFAGSGDAIVSEQILKSTLMRPADQEFINRLSALAKTVRRSVHDVDIYNNNKDPYINAWRHFALGLYEFRRGRNGDALYWLGLCMNSPQHHRCRMAMAQAVSAMARYRMGQAAEAQALLEASRRTVTREFETHLAAGGPANGYWYDWINARQLLREAESVCESDGS